MEPDLIVAVQAAHQNRKMEVIRKNRTLEAAKAKDKREEVARVEIRKFQEDHFSWKEKTKLSRGPECS